MRLTDQQLLARVADGDRAAFGELYDRCAPRLFGLLVKLTRNRAEAEDVLQEVFLHVWRKAGRYDPGLSQPIVWLMLIARARAIDGLRRRASQADMLAKAPRPPETINHAALNGTVNDREPSNSVSAAMASLPIEQSDAIGLAFHGGLTAAQIAALRGVPVGTVKTRIRLGMMKLRDAVNTGVRAWRTNSEVAT